MSFFIEPALIVTAGAIASALAQLLQVWLKKKKTAESLEDRIKKLSDALQQSSHLVSEVEAEISERQKLVNELQKDAEKYEALKAINQEQVDAVAQVLSGELRKEGNKSFWKSVAVNTVFFICGAALSWYFTVGF